MVQYCSLLKLWIDDILAGLNNISVSALSIIDGQDVNTALGAIAAIGLSDPDTSYKLLFRIYGIGPSSGYVNVSENCDLDLN